MFFVITRLSKIENYYQDWGDLPKSGFYSFLFDWGIFRGRTGSKEGYLYCENELVLDNHAEAGDTLIVGQQYRLENNRLLINSDCGIFASKEEQFSVIRYLVGEGAVVCEVHRRMKAMHGEHALSLIFVQNWNKHVQEKR